jgi:transcriptional regulator
MLEAVTDPSPASLNHQSQSQSAAADRVRGAGSYLPGEVLVIFTSPVDHYITPHFYTAAKAAAGAGTTAEGVETGKARIAPTWNYAAVQVYGRMRVFHDSGSEDTGLFLHRQLSDLARLGEEGVMGFSGGEGISCAGDTGTSPWKLEDAPEKYIATLKKSIVGMQVEITRVEGRFKVSQERPVGDRAGVVDGLEGRGGGVARRMAEFVRDGRVV